MTLIELILTCGILAVLASAALPLMRGTVQRQKEQELRRNLRELRVAIDRYKDDAENHLIRTEVDTMNYPPDLQTLVDGVVVTLPAAVPGATSASAVATASAGSAAQAAGPGPSTASASSTPNKVRYLRAIPIDPMTGKADWRLSSVQDDPDSDSWGGQDVFDVHSQSTGTAIDGTSYNKW